MATERVSRAFGRVVGLAVSDDAAARTELPFWWHDEPGLTPEAHWTLSGDGTAVIGELELWVAEHARTHTFVHAGVVGIGGAAIVLPGRTFSGKSTLVAALLALGAEYGSDEYALIDPQGLVHAYPRPLSLRSGGGVVRLPVAAATMTACPAALVAVLTYDPAAAPEAGFTPAPLTRAEAVLRLLDNTVSAASRPAPAIAALDALTAPARCISGARAEAAVTATALVDLVATGS
ncbi:hypothetical protein [Jatrophihabitans sp.]|uniref:hypothetical protein n=1 Tax=Jatrophihabitans sp. TaxID=1932789 RepID=UPI0030C721BD|nr:hypothetical protein [Jatrophihabitans sp.]